MRVSFAVAAIACATLSLVGTRARAAGWADSFQADAVASYLRATDKAILVAAGGAASEARDEAAKALVQALRAGKKLQTVMTAESLGSLADLDDAAIAKKSGFLPVDLVAIVRVFPAAEGEQPTAVVALYSKAGEAVTAFSAQKGAGVAASSVSSAPPPGQGATSSAVQAVATLRPDASPDAKEEYEKNYVWFEDWVGLNQYGGQVARWTNAYRGKYKVPLDGAKFYEEVGHLELAEQYRSRATTRGWVMGGSAVVAAAGLVAMMAGVFTMAGSDCDYGDENYDQCSEDQEARSLTWVFAGAGGVGVGVLGVLAGGMINPNPVDPSQARQLADEHNKKLKNQLGVVATSEESKPDKSPLRLNLALGQGAGGLVLRGSF